MDPSTPTDLAEAIAGHERGVAYDFSPSSPTLLITFGGLARAPGLGPVPPFEFVNASASFAVKKLFLRDHRRSWYHRGVVGLGGDLDSVTSRLRELIAESGAERTVALGNSSGGYAALMFGDLLALSEVHTFSPQTFIDPRLREELGDARWDDSVQELIRSGGFDERFGDLKERLVTGTGATAFHVYHPAQPIDVVHAQRVSDAQRVTTHSYDHPGHWLIGRMRNDGSLQALLERSLLGD
jgi:hypothetical protein